MQEACTNVTLIREERETHTVHASLALSLRCRVMESHLGCLAKKAMSAAESASLPPAAPTPPRGTYAAQDEDKAA